MANLIIQENGVARTRPAVNGEEVTIKAPCDCSAVTGVQINGIAFPFYDALGNSLANINGLFAEGSLIRVLVDTDNTRAYILNANTNAYLEARLADAGGGKPYYGTIGTAWTEDEETGAKYQFVAIAGITADKELGRLDTVNTHERTSEGYAAYVEEQNQFLEFITNGDAETVDGGVMFYIYGEPNTVAIPFGLVV